VEQGGKREDENVPRRRRGTLPVVGPSITTRSCAEDRSGKVSSLILRGKGRRKGKEGRTRALERSLREKDVGDRVEDTTDDGVEDVADEAGVAGGETVSLRGGTVRRGEDGAGGREGEEGDTHVVEEEEKSVGPGEGVGRSEGRVRK
jgi:hypothetical protein